MFVCFYVCMYVCLCIIQLLLDALYLGRQTFRGSSTIQRSDRVFFFFIHPAEYLFYEQSNYPLYNCTYNCTKGNSSVRLPSIV